MAKEWRIVGDLCYKISEEFLEKGEKSCNMKYFCYNNIHKILIQNSKNTDCLDQICKEVFQEMLDNNINWNDLSLASYKENF